MPDSELTGLSGQPVHPAWLPAEAFAVLGASTVLVLGEGQLIDTVRTEVATACARYDGHLVDGKHETPDAVLALADHPNLPPAAARVRARLGDSATELGDQGFAVERSDGMTVLLAGGPAGLLYGLFHLVRLGDRGFGADLPLRVQRPASELRMLNHWDNVDVHPFMGQVERGYAGGSIFWQAGARRSDPADEARIRQYARLLAACGINAISVNNVNVHATEARLLTDRLDDVAAIAALVRPFGIRVHLSVSFAAPMTLGGLETSDPLDPEVLRWWRETTDRVYATIPDFGGYVVKADSEGQPGPFAYGRTHADGANLLAAALEPHGGVVHWRAFVYNHRQDWRDRTTDRARAAYDHFAPLDGKFASNAILQVKYGPIDFQTREPISPVIAAMRNTRLAVELQVTQEYTGQQRHVCYLAPLWSQVLGFRFWGDDGQSVAALVGNPQTGAGLAAVSNVGDDEFWTGHPLAQANLYAYGRLAWDPTLDPTRILDEWIDLTFCPAGSSDPRLLRESLHQMMDGSWLTYERYTAPLGVGFMVNPNNHYGPSVDGYEYSPWGTYHFADRDGIGVDRTVATGTGYTGQYPPFWAEQFESLETCPDELLLFFHHVSYQQVLHSGSTVIQHIYDTHFQGVEEAVALQPVWQRLVEAGLVDERMAGRVNLCLVEQVRCAREWCDQVNTYFLRKSGVADARGRRIF